MRLRDPDRLRAVSADGNEAMRRKGVQHEFTKDEARDAGRKGAAARWGARRRRDARQNDSD